MSTSPRVSSIPALRLLPPRLTSCWLSPSPPPSVSLPFLPCSTRTQQPPPVVITTSISPWRLCQPFQQKHLLGGQSTSSIPEPSGCGGEETKSLPQAEGQGLPPPPPRVLPCSQLSVGHTHTPRALVCCLHPSLCPYHILPSVCLSPSKGKWDVGSPNIPGEGSPVPL